MIRLLSDIATRFRLLVTRALTAVGFGDDSFLLFLALLIGVTTAVAALGFHELTRYIRDSLYVNLVGGTKLYNEYVWLLVLLPAAGGLVVGIVSKVFRVRAGHGVVDVIESVIRTTGFVKPKVALEKILTSAVTLGTGGSSGAEGPIVQIGAAISAGVGSLFRVSRQHMPVIVGCGCAAGISAIFNAPLGGLLFTLEVILFDFSVRTITPLVIASVIANVTTRALYGAFHSDTEYFTAIFAGAHTKIVGDTLMQLSQVGNFAVLGLLCGVVSVSLTRMMGYTEKRFARLDGLGVFKPALGGALVGLLGLTHVMIFGWAMMHRDKPIDVGSYPMPAFFGDGYGVISVFLGETFYNPTLPGSLQPGQMIQLLVFVLLAKIVATCLTLGSGGSGGVIAPALFLGATTGALAGMLLRVSGLYPGAQPGTYALVGMGACLAGVVHAPLASVLILFEITQDYRVMLAAMLCSIVSIGTARFFEKDSIYMKGLRHRGIAPGAPSDLATLRRLTLEHIALEPATTVRASDPFSRVLDLIDAEASSHFFVVVDGQGHYNGVLTSEDLQLVLRQQDAVPLMIISEIARTNVPLLSNTDSLAGVFETFSRLDVSHLAVGLSDSPGKVIGVISRAGLMRRYHRTLNEE